MHVSSLSTTLLIHAATILSIVSSAPVYPNLPNTGVPSQNAIPFRSESNFPMIPTTSAVTAPDEATPSPAAVVLSDG
jgi:hypothetical protein